MGRRADTTTAHKDVADAGVNLTRPLHRRHPAGLRVRVDQHPLGQLQRAAGREIKGARGLQDSDVHHRRFDVRRRRSSRSSPGPRRAVGKPFSTRLNAFYYLVRHPVSASAVVLPFPGMFAIVISPTRSSHHRGVCFMRRRCRSPALLHRMSVSSSACPWTHAAGNGSP